MKRFLIICIYIIFCMSILIANENRKIKVEIKMSNNVKKQLATDKLDKDGKLVLETEIEGKIYKTIKPIKIFEGKYWTDKFYLIKPSIGTYPSKGSIISKEEYDKNPEAYKKQDIYLGRLPEGTIFELVNIHLDSAAEHHCNYYIKILNMPEYKDILVDAMCISYMAIDGVWEGDWDWFVNKEKRLIKTKKLPLINKIYAEELTKKEYEEYYKSQKS